MGKLKTIHIQGSINTLTRHDLPDGTEVDTTIFDLSNRELRLGRRQIKGMFGSFLDEELFVPFGVHGFFYSIPDSKLGVKVYYSFDRGTARSKSASQKTWNRYKSCYDADLSPKVISMVDVNLDLIVNSKKVQTKCFGILSEKVFCPEDELKKFAQGQVYDFNCLDIIEHPKHTAQDYQYFRDEVIRTTAKLKITHRGVKLGDILYCMNEKRWYLVDCG